MASDYSLVEDLDNEKPGPRGPGFRMIKGAACDYYRRLASDDTYGRPEDGIAETR